MNVLTCTFPIFCSVYKLQVRHFGCTTHTHTFGAILSFARPPAVIGARFFFCCIFFAQYSLVCWPCRENTVALTARDARLGHTRLPVLPEDFGPRYGLRARRCCCCLPTVCPTFSALATPPFRRRTTRASASYSIILLLLSFGN